MGSLRGIEIRGSGQKFKIEQILFQNFFGGSSNMAAKKDEVRPATTVPTFTLDRMS